MDKKTSEELEKELSSAVGHLVTVINNHNGTFGAWIHTDIPYSERVRLTPILANASGGKQVALAVIIQAEKVVKGFHAEIYESKQFGNCSNSGISSRCKQVTIIPSEDCPTIPQMFEPTEDAPAVTLHWSNAGREYGYNAKPADKGGKWWMMGGCFIYSCDSRFREAAKHPIPLHDRTE